jgi:tetratricopeptide (TPR) repeat protein
MRMETLRKIRMLDCVEELAAPQDKLVHATVTKDSLSLPDHEAALSRTPADLPLRLRYGLALAEAGHLDRAVITLAEGARYHPGNPDLAVALARLLTGQGQHDPAQQVLTAALRARPDNLELRGLLAAELAADLKCAAAIRHLLLLLALLPDQSLVYANLGVLQQTLGEVDAAIVAYRRAIQIDAANPVGQVNLGTALMTRGEYEAGFEHYEHRLSLPDIRRPPADLRRWHGGEPAGRLLVSAEQGFGDVLQFARFLPRLAAWADEIWLDCPAEMKRLFEGMAPLAGVVGPGERIPEVDCVVPLLSLPRCMRTGADLLTESIPYIKVPAEGPALAPDRRPRIGLAWSGRSGAGELFVRRTLSRRSCSFGDLAPLWSIEDFCFFSLQLGEAAKTCHAPVRDLSPLIGDFADSAVLVSQLDLMISIDSAPAHLAGAIGVPLWVMLGQGQADYRWGGIRGRSPWYPKARLFRAGPSGWPALAGEVAEALRAEPFA